ncbi:hypothetical protein F5Y04DRAFT_256522 [Hypomontagnella monticulosa]|nr:hypothetical protein F5Y04DRAFT_256522 [Hypomontagnella monticulosa]
MELRPPSAESSIRQASEEQGLLLENAHASTHQLTHPGPSTLICRATSAIVHVDNSNPGHRHGGPQTCQDRQVGMSKLQSRSVTIQKDQARSPKRNTHNTIQSYRVLTLHVDSYVHILSYYVHMVHAENRASNLEPARYPIPDLGRALGSGSYLSWVAAREPSRVSGLAVNSTIMFHPKLSTLFTFISVRAGMVSWYHGIGVPVPIPYGTWISDSS